MNKIFKVVWSKVKHCYVVVSEIAKNTISGGARRSRVRKGALAAALVTAFLSSSFAMPNSAWAAYGNMGNSYEALVVLTATKNVNTGEVAFGVDLYRGDNSEKSGVTYLKPHELEAAVALGLVAYENYHYTKVTSVGASTEFSTALEQTVINQIISSVENGENVSVSEFTDANGIVGYAINALDTKNESVSLSINESNELVVSVTDADGVSKDADGNLVKHTLSGSINLEDLKEKIDTNTTYEVVSVEAANLSGNQVNKWNVNRIDNQNSTPVATITDTDTFITRITATYDTSNNTNSDGTNSPTKIITTYNKNYGDPLSGFSFIAGDGINLSVDNNAITISSVTGGVGSGSSDLGFTSDDKININVDNENNLVEITANVSGVGYLPTPSEQMFKANAKDGTTGVEYKGQLKKLRIGKEEFDVSVITAIESVEDGTPLLRAVELNGQEYRIADPAWTVKVANKLASSEAFSTFTVSDGNEVEYVAGSNIVLSAEATSTGGKITVATADNVGFNSVTVGGNDSGNVVINNSGIYMGNRNITGLAAGVDDMDAVNVSQLEDAINNINTSITNSGIKGGEILEYTYKDVNDNQVTGTSSIVLKDIQGNQIVTLDGLKDTTLVAGATKTTVDGSNTYTFADTRGNKVVIDDVASATSVNERFEDVNKDITEINNKITTIEGDVTEIKNSIEDMNGSVAAAKTEVVEGNNVTIEKTTGSNGQDIYEVSAKDTVTTIEAGDNVVVSGGLNNDGNYAYTISATDTNTTNKNMEGTGWVDGTDNLLIKVNDSDSKYVEATIEDVAKASDLKQEIIDRQVADSALAAGLNKLGNRMNKVGAGSAALAALHPMDFDPDDKLQFSAGVGHYGGENAAALGAFYRPTEKVMFSVAGTMGNGEDMVNAGVTFALDKPNNVSNSRVAMAREIQDLRQQVAALTMLVMQMASRDNAALAGVAMFPDVPENHWAYDYIEGLQKQGIIEGYPDGNFGGDRSMTRYEFAAMLYRALEKGFPVDSRLLNEFNAELGRIRVDRIKGADNDAKKVERVRVNNYEDRDDYGSKIVQVKAGA